MSAGVDPLWRTAGSMCWCYGSINSSCPGRVDYRRAFGLLLLLSVLLLPARIWYVLYIPAIYNLVPGTVCSYDMDEYSLTDTCH